MSDDVEYFSMTDGNVDRLLRFGLLVVLARLAGYHASAHAWLHPTTDVGVFPGATADIVRRFSHLVRLARLP